jgi:Cu-Zn family superoxide dismutase
VNGHLRIAIVLPALAAAACASSSTETLVHAMATLDSKSGSTARGAAIFSAASGQVTLQLYVTGATAGMHMAHIHQLADCSAADATSVGDEWTGFSDLGQIEIKPDGTGTLRVTSDKWAVDGTGMNNDLTGHSVVLHEMDDDSPRIACGAIRMLEGNGPPTMDPNPSGPSGRTASVQIWPRSGSPAYGTATFTEVQGGVEVRIMMSNLTPGNHGAHIHTIGDCTDGAALSTGGHWTLDGGAHPAHLGDMPNMTVGPDGTGTLTFTSPDWLVDAPLVNGTRPPNDVVGHALVVHALEDDMMTQPSGNSGARVACGVIGLPPAAAPSTALVRVDARSGTTLSGNATFTAANGTVTFKLDVSGITPGLHAVHIHDKGDCSAFDAVSAGGHWNPTGSVHGLPDGGEHHAGDIGNMTVGPDGKGSVVFASTYWNVIGMNTVLGHALVVHQGVDDGVSQPTGDAGFRAGCGLITLENQQPAPPRVVEYTLDPKSGSTSFGTIKLTETGNAITVQLDVVGGTPGMHDVMMHLAPDCSATDAVSAGGEWPVGPNSIGMLTVAANGQGRLLAINPRWMLGDGGVTAPPAAADGGVEDKWPDGGYVRYDLAGHALIVQAGSGADAGARVSCGVIR